MTFSAHFKKLTKKLCFRRALPPSELVVVLAPTAPLKNYEAGQPKNCYHKNISKVGPIGQKLATRVEEGGGRHPSASYCVDCSMGKKTRYYKIIFF